MATPIQKTPLEITDPTSTCESDGYHLILSDLERELSASPGQPLSPDSFLKAKLSDACFKNLLSDPKKAYLTKQFLRQVAAYDGQSKSISAYDIAVGIFELYGPSAKENLLPQIIRALGAPLLDPKSSPAFQSQSLDLLHSLAIYVGTLPASDPTSRISQSLDYYFNQKEPVVFTNFLNLSFKDFLNLDDAKINEAFAAAIKTQFPTASTVESLFDYLTFPEAVMFTKECFKANILASLPLFETVRLPKLRSLDETINASSDESNFFPNLPQDTPFKDRQKAIDDFLGKPVLVLKPGFWETARKNAKVTIKKYLWMGNTEVFSIESGKPGPTTLVFSPHYHEKNPRKIFHWLKDIPLQSGRVIFIPEANRALGLANGYTVPMNRIFNKALSGDRIDYLVVRRTEYLMGLVDGMIGLHDWSSRDPFFISDIISDVGGPVPGQWIPKWVQGIGEVSHSISEEEGVPGETPPTMRRPPQIQWKVAESASHVLERLSGRKFTFVVSPITGEQSRRIDNATAYMNYFLHKPAMTFEGTAEAEHGQLEAMAVYSLLAAFGHRIDRGFVEILNIPKPKMNPHLYIGLPISTPTPATTEHKD